MELDQRIEAQIKLELERSLKEMYWRLQVYQRGANPHYSVEEWQPIRQKMLVAIPQAIARREAEIALKIAQRMIIEDQSYLDKVRITANAFGPLARASLEQTLGRVAGICPDATNAKVYLYSGGRSNHPEYKADFSWACWDGNCCLMNGGITLHIQGDDIHWGSHT